jgi:hypothetical protein
MMSILSIHAKLHFTSKAVCNTALLQFFTPGSAARRRSASVTRDRRYFDAAFGPREISVPGRKNRCRIAFNGAKTLSVAEFLKF